MKKFYGTGVPGVRSADLSGSLIVIEGGDGAGRSTQIRLMKDWLERSGYPAVEVGLKRSDLVGEELTEAMKGNNLCPLTLSLFYVTDFADQLENSIIPALRAGFVVLADRYIYTLIARHAVRGVSSEWLTAICQIAVIPDLIFHLKVAPEVLASRTLAKQSTLDYWESGMDIERHGDIYQCFVQYQSALSLQFEKMSQRYRFVTVDGENSPGVVHSEIVQVARKLFKNSTSQLSESR